MVKVWLLPSVKNSGAVRGKETAQIYVRDLQSTIFRPEKELKGFTKIELEPGEEREVTIKLGRRAFAFYDIKRTDWVVEKGDFEIMVGSSSRDIRLAATVYLESTVSEAVSPADREKLAGYYNLSKDSRFGKDDFETLLGRPVPPNRSPQKGDYTLNTAVCELSGSFLGRLFIKVVTGQVNKMVQGIEDTPTALLLRTMVREMPLRGLLMQGDTLSRPGLEALLLIFNGHLFKGLAALVKVLSQKKR